MIDCRILKERREKKYSEVRLELKVLVESDLEGLKTIYGTRKKRVNITY